MPKRIFSLWYPSLPPEELRSCYGGVGEMLDLPVRDEVGRHPPEPWALRLLRRAATILVPDYDAPANRKEGVTEESRDDNGSYILDGSFREGGARHYLLCDWSDYQHEQMVGSAPWRKSAFFQAKGLGRGRHLTIEVRRKGPGYSNDSDEAYIVVRIQAPEEAVQRIERLIISELCIRQRANPVRSSEFGVRS